MLEFPFVVERIFHYLQTVLDFFIDGHLHQHTCNELAYTDCHRWDCLEVFLAGNVNVDCPAKDHLEDPYCE